jgi:hypothetical protein
MILVPLEHANAMFNSLNALLWPSDSKLDHSSRLIWLTRMRRRLERIAYLIGTQLEVVSLIWDQVTKFHRKYAGLVSDNQGKIPILKINVVGALEVIVHRNLFLGVCLAVSQLEDGVLSMSTLRSILRTVLPGEPLDRVDLSIFSNGQPSSSNPECLTYHLACLDA